MIKTIWFFVKITLFVTGAVWLATRQGAVSLQLFEYDITVQAGLFFISLAVLLFVLIYVLRFLRAFVMMPKTIAKMNAERGKKKSFRALTRGLVAVAAGDAKRATQYAKQTKDLWPDLNGLPLLLEAQAAQLRGETGLAQNRFERLLDTKDAAFLGVRGLLNQAMADNDYTRALDFAREAEKKHPKQPWVIQCVYELEIKNRLWRDALRTNHKAMSLKVYDEGKLMSDRVAIYLHEHDKALRAGELKRALSEVEKAFKLDQYFIPTIRRYSRHLLEKGKKRKCLKIVEAAWRANPHPDLVEIWQELGPVAKGKNHEKDQAQTMAWVEKLVTMTPENVEAQIAAARTAMDLGFWGEARAYLMVAEKLYPSARVFRYQAMVEQHRSQNDDSIHQLMERAAEALPDKVWVCQETGMVYDEWSAIAKPHKSFNTIEWNFAGARAIKNNNVLSKGRNSMLLIDPAA